MVNRTFFASTYKLVNGAVTIFDRAYFPDKRAGINFPLVHTATLDAGLKAQRERLPQEVGVKILDQAENVAHFITMSGIFSKNLSLNELEIAQESARHLLQRLGQATTDHKATPVQQLLEYVFEEGFAKATKEQKWKLLECAADFPVLTHHKRRIIRITLIVASIIQNPFVFYPLIFVNAVIALKIYCQLKTYWLKSLRPKIVNFIINHASIQEVRVLNKVMKVWDYCLLYHWVTSYTGDLIKSTLLAITQPYPLVSKVVHYTYQLSSIPYGLSCFIYYRLPEEIFFKILLLGDQTVIKFANQAGSLAVNYDTKLIAERIEQLLALCKETIEKAQVINVLENQ